jgi:citrate lyase subunit beta/citryl-CoA lyase
VLDALDRAAGDEGRGAVRFGDEMVDEASRNMAVKVVARGERAGLVRAAPR